MELFRGNLIHCFRSNRLRMEEWSRRLQTDYCFSTGYFSELMTFVFPDPIIHGQQRLNQLRQVILFVIHPLCE